jgi:hypothetical protein
MVHKSSQFVPEGIPLMFYAEWYQEKIKPNLSRQQKEKLMKKISDISLTRDITSVGVEFSKKDFPELAPYSHTEKISGLQLYAVMTEIFHELNPAMGKKIGKSYPTLG